MAEMPSKVTVTIPLYTKIGDSTEFIHLGDCTIDVPVEVSATRTSADDRGSVHMRIPEGAGMAAAQQIQQVIQAAESGSKCTCDSPDKYMLGPSHADDCPLVIRRRTPEEIAEYVESQPIVPSIPGH